MKPVHFKILTIAVAALVLAISSHTAGYAQDWEEGFPVRITYQELGGQEAGYANVTLLMSLSSGTPLLGRENAINSALSALHDLWNMESVHDDIRGFLGPVVPVDVQHAAAGLSGADFILAIIDAFDTVSDGGFSRFQIDTPVRSTEKISIVPEPSTGAALFSDAPRFFAWVVGGIWETNTTGHENWVLAAVINYSAAILSFRSELGRFPSSFAELMETNHVLIEPLNPYTASPVENVGNPSPGNITYEYIDPNRVMLYAYIEVGDTIDVVRREINVAHEGAFDLLYRETAGLSEEEKQVARYTFQIAQILNEYYFQYLDLPYSVPQCEAEGFAYVSFPNPFTGRDAPQAESLSETLAGSYSYHRISGSEYFLVGYGESGEAVLSVSKNFGPSLSSGTSISR